MAVRVEIDVSRALLKVRRVSEIDKSVALYAHNRLAAYCDPYVPMETGTMSQSAEITAEYVRYPGPYAHYQYVGEVYGPNIPIRENGVITGWFSPPGQQKQPMGRALNYSQDLHPLAQSEWDRAAMAIHKQDLADEVRDFMLARKGL